MTDKTDSKEREKFKAAHPHLELDEVPDAWGRPAFKHSHVEASWLGWKSRASLAASAGSEPVYQARYRNGFWQDSSRERFEYLQSPEITSAEDWETRILYANPFPPEGMVGGWIALPGTLPEPGVPVLLDIGKKYPIRAMWAAKHTVEAADDDTDWGEYDEATETYYCPEGWYEWNEHEDTNWAVSATPRAWATLPPTTSAGSGKGG